MEYLQKVNWYKEMEELLFSGGEATNDKKDYLEYFQQKTPIDDVFLTSFPSEFCKDLSELEQISKFTGKKLVGKCGEVLEVSSSVDKDQGLKKRKASVVEDIPTQTQHVAKKEHHNYIEKKRRKKINSELEQLKELNPYCKNASANKLSILHFTCEYIQNLQDSYKKMLDTNKNLKEKNDKVQAEIREFQKFMFQNEESQVVSSGQVASTRVPSRPFPQNQSLTVNYLNTGQTLSETVVDSGQYQPPYNHSFNQYSYAGDSPQSQVQVQPATYFSGEGGTPAPENFQQTSIPVNQISLFQQQQQQLKLQLAQQQQQQLQQLQQRLHSPNYPISGHPPQQQTPKRTTWTFTQIPPH